MLPQTFDYLTPPDIEQAAAWKQSQEGAVYLAGGTDVVPLMQYGVFHPPALIALGNVPQLSSIVSAEDRLVIGAGTTLFQLAGFAHLHPVYRGLFDAAKAVASPQIRRIGTVGGNLLQAHRCYYYNQSAHWRQAIAPCFKTGGTVCHQAPSSPVCRALYYSDLAPMLLSLGAALETASGQTLALEQICGIPDSLGGELARCIIIPQPHAIMFTSFYKIAVRGAIDFALGNAGLTLRTGNQVRLVMGAMTPQPVALEETQALLGSLLEAGAPFDPSVYESARREGAKLARPIREAGVSGQVKMSAVNAVLQVIRELERFCWNPVK